MAINVWHREYGVVSGSSKYEGGFEWRITAQNPATLTSTVEIRQWVIKNLTTGGMWNLFDNTSYYNINGVNYNFTSRIDTRQATTGEIYYMEADGSTPVFPKCTVKTVQIVHADEGAMTIPVKTYLYGGVSGYIDDITTNVNITLDPIVALPPITTPDTFITVTRLIDSKKVFVVNLPYPIETLIVKELEFDQRTLTFKVEDIYDIKEEDYLLYYGDEWIVKEIIKNGQFYSVTAINNVEKIDHTLFPQFVQTNKNLTQVIAYLFGYLTVTEYGNTGWNYQWGETLSTANPASPYYAEAVATRSRQRNLELKRITARDVLKEIISIWNIEVEFDTLNKIVILHKQRGEDKGVYFSSQLNLRQIQQRSDTNEFITRLIPIGKDDLTIKSVNSGSVVLDNHQYSEKTIAAYWVDTNYTSAQALKDDATVKLAALSKPTVTYSCDIIDLREVYPMLSYDMGDAVTIIDTQLNIRTSQRIVKMTIHPQKMEENSVEMANRTLSLKDIQQSVFKAAENLREITLPNGEVAGGNVNTGDGTTLNDTVNTLVTIVTDESQLSPTMTGILFSNENQTIGATASNIVVLDTTVYTGIVVSRGNSFYPATIGTVEFYDTDNNLLTLSPTPVITMEDPTAIASGSIDIFLASGTNLQDSNGYVRIQFLIDDIPMYKKIYWSCVSGTLGQDALSAILSNESVVVSTGADGSGGDYSIAQTSMQVFVGPIDDTSNWAFSAATSVGISGGFDLTYPNKYKLDAVGGLSDGVDDGYVDITATQVNYPDIVKRFSISKSKSGANGTDGDDGLNAQYVLISGDQAFKFLAGEVVPTVTSITLTATLFGGLTTYDWEYWNGSAWANLSGTQNTQTYALAYNNAAWGSNTSLRVRCLSGTIFTEITVVKLYDGSNGVDGDDGVSAISGYLTNEAVAVSAASNGTGYVLTSAGGTFKMFEGITDRTTASTFNITGGTDAGATWSKTQNGLTFTINETNGAYALTGASWTSELETFTVNGTYGGVTITKTYTITKAKAGTNGTDGTDGVDAISGYLTNEVTTVAALYDGTGYDLGTSGGTFKVLSGVTDVTTSALFSIVGGTDGGTSWSKTQNGLTLSIGEVTGIFTLSGGSWNSDEESFSLVAVYNGVTITKLYNISKSKDGAPTKFVEIFPTGNSLVSTDGGVTYSPYKLFLVPKFVYSTYNTWEYSIDGTVFNSIPGTYPAWADTTPYVVGDTVSYSGGKYQCILAHTSGDVDVDILVEPTTWQINTAYTVGQVVKYRFEYYRVLVDHTSSDFTANYLDGYWSRAYRKWVPVSDPVIGVSATWLAGTTYATDDLVLNSGTAYRCLGDHTASLSFANDAVTYWSALGDTNVLTVPHNAYMFSNFSSVSFRISADYTANGTPSVDYAIVNISRTLNTNDNLQDVVDRYESSISTIDQWQVERGTVITDLETRMDDAEILLTPEQITLAVKSQSGFELDVNGVPTGTIASQAFVTTTAGNVKIAAETQIRNEYGEVIENISSHFDFAPTGMSVSSPGSEFAATFSNTELAFKAGGTTVASIGSGDADGNQFNIKKGKVEESLIVGAHKIEKYSAGITIVRFIG